MIKGTILEIVTDCMARSTIGSRGRVRIRRLRLSYGSGSNMFTTAIMARFAITGDARVIEN